MLDSKTFLNKLMGTSVGARLVAEAEQEAERDTGRKRLQAELEEIGKQKREESRRYAAGQPPLREALEVAQRAHEDARRKASEHDDRHWVRMQSLASRERAIREQLSGGNRISS